MVEVRRHRTRLERFDVTNPTADPTPSALAAYEELVATLAGGAEVAQILAAVGHTFEALGRDVAERDHQAGAVSEPTTPRER